MDKLEIVNKTINNNLIKFLHEPFKNYINDVDDYRIKSFQNDIIVTGDIHDKTTLNNPILKIDTKKDFPPIYYNGDIWLSNNYEDIKESFKDLLVEFLEEEEKIAFTSIGTNGEIFGPGYGQFIDAFKDLIENIFKFNDKGFYSFDYRTSRLEKYYIEIIDNELIKPILIDFPTYNQFLQYLRNYLILICINSLNLKLLLYNVLDDHYRDNRYRDPNLTYIDLHRLDSEGVCFRYCELLQEEDHEPLRFRFYHLRPSTFIKPLQNDSIIDIGHYDDTSISSDKKRTYNEIESKLKCNKQINICKNCNKNIK